MSFLDMACAICARGEKSAFDIEQYLIKKDADKEQILDVIEYLLENNYINHSRYVHSFINDKLNFAHWGKNKIISALILKKIDRKLIDEAFLEFDEQIINQKTFLEIDKKLKSLKNETDKQKLKAKLLRFCFSRGFQIDTCIEYINKVI